MLGKGQKPKRSRASVEYVTQAGPLREKLDMCTSPFPWPLLGELARANMYT